MSWQAWVEPIKNCEGIDTVGIYGIDGNEWAQLGDKLAVQDINTLGSIITDGNRSPSFGTGVSFSNKTRWTVVRVEEDCVILKGKGEEYKEYSLVAIKTNQAYVVAYSKTSAGSARDINNRVRGLAENLKSSGY